MHTEKAANTDRPAAIAIELMFFRFNNLGTETQSGSDIPRYPIIVGKTENVDTAIKAEDYFS